tara:strand:- start:3877 stop:5172 length:1296 start_codon:yes stop_codon:yes gene_type:complete
MTRKFKKIIFYFILFTIFFIILEILSSFILLKRYSSKNLISGIEKTNFHFIYLTSKLYEKSLEKLNLKKKDIQRPFHDKYFFYPNEIVNYPEWTEVLENIFEDDIQNIKDQLVTYEKLLFNYRTPTLDYIYTNKNTKLSRYEKEVLYFDGYERASYINNSNLDCWVFGGSTLFGDKLKNDQTLTSELNKIQSKYNFINYGLPGYNSNLQLRYLINLLKLKKKDLPACVIFFDGINDSLDFIKSPLIHPVERSSDPEILFEARTNKIERFNKKYYPFGTEYNDELKYLLKYDIEELSRQTVGIKFDLRDTKLKINDEDIMIKLTAENYIDNGVIAKSILKEIDQNLFFIRYLQPNSFLDKKNNPFLKKEFFDSSIYHLNDKFYNYVKNNFQNNFVDLSDLINICTDNCYSDQGHYSQQFIKIIAENINKELN